MRIQYKHLALCDLQEKQDYIANTLKNKTAAKQLTASILRGISQLADHPRMGTPLNSKFDIDSDLRFLIIAKQLVFYRLEDQDTISIIRVLDGRQDYISLLFDA